MKKFVEWEKLSTKKKLQIVSFIGSIVGLAVLFVIWLLLGKPPIRL